MSDAPDAPRRSPTLLGGWASDRDDAPGLSVVLGLTDGRSVAGRVDGFDPDAPEVSLWVGASSAEVAAFSRRLVVAADRLAYVAFCASPDDPPPPPRDGAEPLRVHVSRDLCFDVRVEGPAEGARGFVGEPLDEASPYREVYFYRDRVGALERLEQLGTILVEMGAVTPENVLRALARQTQIRLTTPGDVVAASTPPPEAPQARLGEVMRGMDLITEAELARALALKFRLPFVDLDESPVDPAAAGAVPRELIERYGMLPVATSARTLTLATREPMTPEHRHLLEFRVGKRVREVIVAGSQLAAHVAAHLRRRGSEPGQSAARVPPPVPEESIEEILRDLGGLAPEDDESLGDDAFELTDNVVVRLVHRIFTDAHRRGASDIHIEPNGPDEKTVVRLRIDGDCVPYLELPPASRRPLVARMKILAGLDIAERRKPQDGKIKVRLSGQAVELRVATLPTSRGDEDAVLRVLASSKPLPLAQMGFSPRNHRELARALARPFGLILCVGPTGSGKTTTLHSMLGAINTPDMKIWTAEDPVEITQPGLRQTQVNPRAGLTFAAAMRAFLRADPDVIMVGEMRDAETAGTAVEASLTGHLVLSTLHTNSAPETVTRLLDMGLDPFSFADALVAVLAQRLARGLCPRCKRRVPATDAQRAEVERALGADALAARLGGAALTVWEAPGCAACGESGYKGRVALHELMVSDAEVKRAVARKAPAEALREVAEAAGMTTLLRDGVEKALEGATDLRQVLAVCGAPA